MSNPWMREFVLLLRDSCSTSATAHPIWRQMQQDNPELDYITEIETYKLSNTKSISSMESKTSTNGFPSICYLDYNQKGNPWTERRKYTGKDEVVKVLLDGKTVEDVLTTHQNRVIKITLCYSDSCEHIQQYLPLWEKMKASSQDTIHFSVIITNKQNGQKLKRRAGVDKDVLPVLIISTRPFISNLVPNKNLIMTCLSEYKSKLTASGEEVKNAIYTKGLDPSKAH